MMYVDVADLKHFLEESNPYPESVFTKKINDVKFWRKVREVLEKNHIKLDTISGTLMRHSWDLCIDRIDDYYLFSQEKRKKEVLK